MKTEELRKKLQEYIDQASPDQLKHLLALVEEEKADYDVETEGAPWHDEEFVKEMDKRVEEIESGKVQGIPWEEVHKKALDLLDQMSRKRNAE